MIVVETALALSVLSTLPKRTRTEDDMHLFCAASPTACFQVATGITLERKVTNELEAIDGVVQVSTQRNGDIVAVNVLLTNLEFPLFERVIQKEMELSDAHPHLQFQFDVMPAQHE